MPDDMDDERIQELMRDTWDDGDLDLNEVEYQDGDEVSVDIGEAPASATTPQLTLTENGLVDEEDIFAAFTTNRLQAELNRRRDTVGEEAMADDEILIKLKNM